MKFDTDTTMKNIWLCLARDARSAAEGIPLSPTFYNCVNAGDWVQMRKLNYAHWFEGEPRYEIKWLLQLENLFKRYKFKKDLYSDEELSDAASQKFLADQCRIATPLHLRAVDLLVIRRARRIIADILGKYDKEEHENLCRFSSRANLGVPFRDAYLEKKAEVLSGTKDQKRWFETYLGPDHVLVRALDECGDRGRLHSTNVYDALRLAKVPKSWKSQRTMLPNTVIGSIYSHGLGELIRCRLLDAGVDIRRLQERHRILARKLSQSRSHATADLSSASDSFNREMLIRLLPNRWYHIVTYGLPRSYYDGACKYSLQSVMTMGMGHTFPLQTLLFYALLTAVQDLAGIKGFISVYGDDLIYPSKMHRYVKDIFPHLNLRLNLDKTFVSSHFRESCGGDYYNGIDVRPFCPEGEHRLLSRVPYTAFLYKLYNGLLLRWEECEIPQTLHYIMCNIVNASNVVFQVPPSYPADSGIQTVRPLKPGIIPWSNVSYRADRQQLSFQFLARVSEKRYIGRQRIYYWDALRALSLRNTGHDVPDGWAAPSVSPVSWVWKYVKKGRKGRFGKGERKLVPVEPTRGSEMLHRQTGLTSMWP